MTNRDAFDRVTKHLLTQMRHSKIDTQCRYRGPDGLKCAIGCLIPDDAYKPEMEGFTIAGLVHHFTYIGHLFNDVDLHMLATLQFIHDQKDPCHWQDELLLAEQALRHLFRNQLSKD